MKVDTSLSDPQAKDMAESFVEDRLSLPLEKALESMEVIDRISDRIKAHNKSLKNLIDDFEHLKEEDFLTENENINEVNKATIENRRKQRRENYPPLELAAEITYTPTSAQSEARNGAKNKKVGKVFKDDPTGEAAIKATEDAISGKLILQDLKDEDFDFKENYEPGRNQNLQDENFDSERKFFDDFYKDLKNFEQKGTKGHKIIMSQMAKEAMSTLRRMEKTNDQEWRKKHGDTFTLKPVDVMRRLLHLRDKVEKMEDSNVTPGFLQAKNKFLQMADKHINNPDNAQLVGEARRSIAEFKEKNEHLQERIDQLKQKASKHGIELINECEKKYGGLGNVSRFYRSVVGGMQHFTKETDEQIIEDFHEMFKDNSVKAKQARAKNAEKIFKTVLEFDEKKATYNSVEELWNDKKHEDLLLLSRVLWDSQGLMEDYQNLLKDPNVDTKLNEEMFKEVKSKIQVFMGFTQISIDSGNFQNFMTDPFAIDADLNKMREMPPAELQSACLESGDPYLSGAYIFVQLINKPDLGPNETFDAAVKRKRKINGLAEISPEEREKRYKKIIGAIQNEDQLVRAISEIKQTAESHLTALNGRPKSGTNSATYTNMEKALAAIRDLKEDAEISDVKLALTQLKNASESYTAAHTGWRHPFIGNTSFGKFRVQQSRDLAEFANSQMADLVFIEPDLSQANNRLTEANQAENQAGQAGQVNQPENQPVQPNPVVQANQANQPVQVENQAGQVNQANQPENQPNPVVQAPEEKEKKKLSLNHDLDVKISDAQAKISNKATSDKELKEAYATIIVAVYIRTLPGYPNQSDNIPKKGESQVDYQLINDTCTFESLRNIMLEDTGDNGFTKWIDNMNRKNPMKLKNAALKDNGGQLFEMFAQVNATKDKKVKPQKNQTAAAKTKKKSNGNINPQNDSGIKTDDWGIMETDNKKNIKNKKLKRGPRK